MAIQLLPTIRDLMAAIDDLPPDDRQAVTVRLEQALQLPAGPRELAVGTIALDLAPEIVVDVTAIDGSELALLTADHTAAPSTGGDEVYEATWW